MSPYYRWIVIVGGVRHLLPMCSNLVDKKRYLLEDCPEQGGLGVTIRRECAPLWRAVYKCLCVQLSAVTGRQRQSRMEGRGRISPRDSNTGTGGRYRGYDLQDSPSVSSSQHTGGNTMSDIGSSFGAAAQTKLERYPFWVSKVVDIEKEPDATLQNTRHIVLGPNILHATRNRHLWGRSYKHNFCKLLR